MEMPSVTHKAEWATVLRGLTLWQHKCQRSQEEPRAGPLFFTLVLGRSTFPIQAEWQESKVAGEHHDPDTVEGPWVLP
jgi:hypothetical protein